MPRPLALVDLLRRRRAALAEVEHDKTFGLKVRSFMLPMSLAKLARIDAELAAWHAEHPSPGPPPTPAPGGTPAEETRV